MNKNNFSITLFLVIISLILEPVFSATTVSIRERKKNLDSRLKIVKEIDSAMGGWDINRSQERMDKIQMKAEESMREKSDREKSRVISLLEEDLQGMMTEYSTKMDSVSEELIEVFSREYFLKNDWKSLRDLDKKEKIQRYFEMAKKERSQGQIYQRMKNPHLALLAYKRSIVYNFHAFLITDTELPSQYHGAYENWMKDSPPKSSGKLAEGGSPMERNEN